ncbi:hypothetical protein [Pseudoalteromonas sp.]|uniref:hypothetical protein n=1 Tax=Pseudoalteromonas sp. TaxID=53249 RepID=UPI0026315CAF|nr:hypothetical protein [Pseudoalteromonas sp.]MCP4585354.1 hypothetical protein [Pseudoalteromonas sp.]
MKTYKNLNTGEVGQYKDFWYEFNGKQVNATELNNDVVIEVELNGAGQWIEKKEKEIRT